MMNNKFFKFSLIFLFIVLILILILGSFLYGTKVGVLRQSPYFDKVIYIYHFSNNFKKNLIKIIDKKNNQKVSKIDELKLDKKNPLVDNLLGIQTGKIPNDFIITSTLSVIENEKVNHYLLFLSNNKILHKIDLIEYKYKKVIDDIKWPHGLIIKNNNIYYNFDNGNSLMKIDLCGNKIWEIEGQFHHLMSINEDYIWALKKDEKGDYDTADTFLKIDTKSAKILQSFNTVDLINANLPYDYFSIKQRDLSTIWDYEPFHYNDVDVLTKEFSNYFSKFSVGDLLISSRSLNSVFVINPENLKVKKFLFGLTRRQHDPDWNKGYITIYDNQTEWGLDSKGSEIRPYESRILKINNLDEDKQSEIKFNSSFVADARGNHHILDLGLDGIYSLIISPYQGKLLLYKDGKEIYTLTNIINSSVLSVSNGKILNKEKFLDKIETCQK